MTWPTREEAWHLLNAYTKSPNLINHALAVEAGMRAYAAKSGRCQAEGVRYRAPASHGPQPGQDHGKPRGTHDQTP